jgi:hypothetical protein
VRCFFLPGKIFFRTWSKVFANEEKAAAAAAAAAAFVVRPRRHETMTLSPATTFIRDESGRGRLWSGAISRKLAQKNLAKAE